MIGIRGIGDLYCFKIHFCRPCYFISGAFEVPSCSQASYVILNKSKRCLAKREIPVSKTIIIIIMLVVLDGAEIFILTGWVPTRFPCIWFSQKGHRRNCPVDEDHWECSKRRKRQFTSRSEVQY